MKFKSAQPLVTWHCHHHFFRYSRVISLLGATSLSWKWPEYFDHWKSLKDYNPNKERETSQRHEKSRTATLEFPHLFVEGINHDRRTFIRRLSKKLYLLFYGYYTFNLLCAILHPISSRSNQSFVTLKSASTKLPQFRRMLHLPFWVQISIFKLNFIRHHKCHIPLNLTDVWNCKKPNSAIYTVKSDTREWCKAYVEKYLLHPNQL